MKPAPPHATLRDKNSLTWVEDVAFVACRALWNMAQGERNPPPARFSQAERWLEGLGIREGEKGRGQLE